MYINLNLPSVLQSTTRSPIFAHFSESLSGTGESCISNDELCISNDELCIRNDEFWIQGTIRAYGNEVMFMDLHIDLFEEHSRT